MAPGPLRLTMLWVLLFLGLLRNAHGQRPFTLGARLKKLSSRSELSPLIDPSCFSVNRRSSTRAALQLAGILPGPTATYLTEAPKTIPSPSNGRSLVSLRTSAIAFWPDPFPHPRRLRGGTQI